MSLASWADAFPWLARAHSDDEVRAWVRDVLLTRGTTWVACSGGRMVGFMTLVGDELEQLYLLPGHYRRGIGKQFRACWLNNKVRGDCDCSPSSATRGPGHSTRRLVFGVVAMSDGSRNEEAEPDVCYEWRPG